MFAIKILTIKIIFIRNRVGFIIVVKNAIYLFKIFIYIPKNVAEYFAGFVTVTIPPVTFEFSKTC